MIIQIWQHKTSGDTYVVELDIAGIVQDAEGPLHHSEVARARIDGVVNPDPELTDWLNDNEDDFRLVEPR